MIEHDYPDFYHEMWVGATVSPHLVSIGGPGGKPKWDVQEAKAQTGGTSVLVGTMVGRFSATFYLVDEEDEIKWEAFRAEVESTTNGPKPKAKVIWHPDLAEAGFTEACNDGIGLRVRDSKGGSTFTVDFIEYRPAKAKPAATAKAVPPGAKKPAAKIDPNAEAKRELTRLLDEAASP